jgi:hypothetical protein
MVEILTKAYLLLANVRILLTIWLRFLQINLKICVALPEATPSRFGYASFLCGQTRSAQRNNQIKTPPLTFMIIKVKTQPVFLC